MCQDHYVSVASQNNLFNPYNSPVKSVTSIISILTAEETRT